MTTPPPDPREALAEVLSAHWRWSWKQVKSETSPGAGDERYGAFCACGEQFDARNCTDSQRDHLADHLARLLATREAEALERAADLRAAVERLAERYENTSRDSWSRPDVVAANLRQLLDEPRARAQEVRRG